MKIFCFNSKILKVVLTLTLGVVFFASLILWTSSQTVFFGYASRRIPIYGVQTDSKKISITFDAAYGSTETKEIIRILKEKNVTTTFFLVGFWVEKHPDLVKEIDEAGFEIGTHSNTHPFMSKLSEAQIRTELQLSMDYITNITGKPVTLFRPPYGDYNDLLVNTCDSMNLKTIQWTVDSLDWKGLNTSQMLARINKDIAGGGIVLFHNNSEHIVEALPTIIDTLKEQGYEFTTVSDLIYHSDYTIDNNGIQIKNK